MKTNKIFKTGTFFGMLGIGLLLAGCGYLKMKDQEHQDGWEAQTKIARVNEKFLFKADLQDVVPLGSNGEDSARMVKRYINSWVRKQLLIDEAASKIEFDQQELERKILDYRYALMVYEYEKHYVNAALHKTVTEEEIKAYYNAHKDNFELKQNIIKGLYVKVPAEAPRQNVLRELLKSDESEDREKLKSYCYRFATDFLLDEAVWVNFEELIVNTPLMSIPNKVQWLKSNKYVETSDQRHVYLLKIIDYKISDELSPLEFVRDQIETIIINKRKAELAARLEKEVYEKAQQNNAFELYAE